MKYLTFFLLIIFLPLKADEVNEEIIFQEKSFSQNNIISSIKSKEILLKHKGIKFNLYRAVLKKIGKLK